MRRIFGRLEVHSGPFVFQVSMSLKLSFAQGRVKLFDAEIQCQGEEIRVGQISQNEQE